MAEREVVVVTGASAGVGRATAQEFARHGAAVGLIARGRAGLDGAARDVERLGGTAYPHAADVAEFEQVQSAAAAIEERLGPIDIWINNAMTTVFDFFEDISAAEYERATRVTYLGTVWGTKVALERMMAARPRHRRAGRLGARVPRDPAAVALLRRQARDQGLVRVAALRASPPRLGRPPDDGPAAWSEHAAVRPLPEPDAPPSPAGAADLPAGGRRARDLLGGAPSPPRALRGPANGLHDPRQQARAVVRRALPREERGQRPADPRPVRRAEGGEPVRAGRRGPRRGSRTACSTSRRTGAAPRRGSVVTGARQRWEPRC